jgi:hypothetical protein
MIIQNTSTITCVCENNNGGLEKKGIKSYLENGLEFHPVLKDQIFGVLFAYWSEDRLSLCNASTI